MVVTAPENALRWVAVAHIDDNTCQPCKDNDGKLYRNRQAAYRDYPGGQHYVNCVGAEFGNECRCKVVKRGRDARSQASESGGTGTTMEIGEIVNRYQSLAMAGMRRLDAGAPPRQPVPVNLKVREPVAGPQNADSAPSPGADLYIYDAIGGWFGIEPMDIIRALDDVSGPLTVHINSPGGSIFDGAAIYDALQRYGATKGPVTARVEGLAASAASFIAMAATEIETTDLGVMMIHDGMASAFGANQDDLMELADLVGMLSDNIAAVYAKRTGGTAQEWRDTMREGDNWYNATQQIEAKLADRLAGATPPAQPAPPTDPEPDNSITSETTDKPAPVDYEGLRLALRGALLS